MSEKARTLHIVTENEDPTPAIYIHSGPTSPLIESSTHRVTALIDQLSKGLLSRMGLLLPPHNYTTPAPILGDTELAKVIPIAPYLYRAETGHRPVPPRSTAA